MLRRHLLVPLMALLAVSLIAAPAAQATDVGMVRLPKDIKYAGRTIEAGRYMVSLGQSSDGPTIVLATKDGSRVADELAIVQVQTKKVRKPRVYVHVTGKDDPQLLRLTVRSDQARYLAFFELAG